MNIGKETKRVTIIPLNRKIAETNEPKSEPIKKNVEAKVLVPAEK